MIIIRNKNNKYIGKYVNISEYLLKYHGIQDHQVDITTGYDFSFNALEGKIYSLRKTINVCRLFKLEKEDTILIDHFTFEVKSDDTSTELEFNKCINVVSIDPDIITTVTGVMNPILLKFFPNLKKISFGVNFNKMLAVGDIPQGVEEINMGFNFNQSIKKNVIPNSVKYLDLGYKFNQYMKPGVIPNGVKTVIMSYSYNKSLKAGIFPESVEYVDLGHAFNKPLQRDVIHENIKTIFFSNAFVQDLGEFDVYESSHIGIGNRLTLLRLQNCNFEKLTILPHIYETTEEIILGKDIPKGVTHITLPYDINYKFKIPSHVDTIEFDSYPKFGIVEILQNIQVLKNLIVGGENIINNIQCFATINRIDPDKLEQVFKYNKSNNNN